MMKTARVRVEVPAGCWIKRDGTGKIDFISPFPSPYNYGSAVGTVAADGEALDALVLGPRIPRGSEAVHRVWGVVRFEDAGLQDDKLICGARPPSQRDLLGLRAFFGVYAVLKSVAAARRRSAHVRFLGVVLYPQL